ncbi:MAG: hypothetical protein ACO3VI_03375 [Ilumatobacteraceae bacterium]
MNATVVVPMLSLPVAAAVASTVQIPVDEYVNSPVLLLTVQPVVPASAMA